MQASTSVEIVAENASPNVLELTLRKVDALEQYVGGFRNALKLMSRSMSSLGSKVDAMSSYASPNMLIEFRHLISQVKALEAHVSALEDISRIQSDRARLAESAAWTAQRSSVESRIDDLEGRCLELGTDYDKMSDRVDDNYFELRDAVSTATDRTKKYSSYMRFESARGSETARTADRADEHSRSLETKVDGLISKTATFAKVTRNSEQSLVRRIELLERQNRQLLDRLISQEELAIANGAAKGEQEQ